MIEIPFDVTVLYLCRCVDCQGFCASEGQATCGVGIGGTSVEWATGKRTIDPDPGAWHYCIAYTSTIVARDTWLFPHPPAHAIASMIVPAVERSSRPPAVAASDAACVSASERACAEKVLPTRRKLRARRERLPPRLIFLSLEKPSWKTPKPSRRMP